MLSATIAESVIVLHDNRRERRSGHLLANECKAASVILQSVKSKCRIEGPRAANPASVTWPHSLKLNHSKPTHPFITCLTVSSQAFVRDKFKDFNWGHITPKFRSADVDTLRHPWRSTLCRHVHRLASRSSPRALTPRHPLKFNRLRWLHRSAMT